MTFVSKTEDSEDIIFKKGQRLFRAYTKRYLRGEFGGYILTLVKPSRLPEDLAMCCEQRYRYEFDNPDEEYAIDRYRYAIVLVNYMGSIIHHFNTKEALIDILSKSKGYKEFIKIEDESLCRHTK